MADNKHKIVAHYEDYAKREGGEDNRATFSRSAGLEFHYTKKIINDFISRDSRILEIGCGTGYYGMYFADKCMKYVGIDLFQNHNVKGFANPAELLLLPK